jgi:hypothetical protein
VVKDYQDGKLPQSEALNKLEKEYASAISENKTKMVNILEKHGYYEDIRYTKDELITVYDKSINSPSELERKEYEKRLEGKIKDILVERTARLEPDECEMITERDYERFKDFIFQDRSEIAELCQENREIAECYKKYRVEIIKKDIQIPKTKIPSVDDHYLMQILKAEAKQAYKYMKRAIEIKLVQYTADGFFNFSCDRGCVGLFFSTAKYTDYKRISPFILINKEPCDVETLRNGAKHGETEQWGSLSKILFGEIK